MPAVKEYLKPNRHNQGAQGDSAMVKQATRPGEPETQALRRQGQDWTRGEEDSNWQELFRRGRI
jgi:hypothetical protein